jgi:undecaprenyl-diphosphatase
MFLHGFYPFVKRRVGRARPYQADATLHTLFDVLDEYSFPSGHTMTLSAALMPIIYTIPGSATLAAGIIGVMGWARVASAHHYPSDVCAGAIIGGGLSYAASMCFLNPL